MILTALIALTSQLSLVKNVAIDNLNSVVYAHGSNLFVAYQQNFGTSPDQIISIDSKGQIVDRLKLTIPTAMIGIDQDGEASFRRSSPGISALKSGKFTGAFYQPDLSSFLMRGKWIINAFQDGLVLLDGVKPKRLITEASSEDTFGLDPASGKLIILKSVKGSIYLQCYEEGEPKPKISKMTSPAGTIDGFPECSLDFIDKDRFLCVLKTPSGPKGEIETTICLGDMKTNSISPLHAISIVSGHQPQAQRNRIAISPNMIAVIVKGGLQFFTHKLIGP